MLRCLSLAALILLPAVVSAQQPTHDEARAALQKAVAFFDEKVSAEGSYLYRYSDDLALREGEEAATATTGWLQPPGTPAVGEALLAAYERSGEKFLLDAAVHTARSLVKGQLQSGGWDNSMEFDP